MTTSRTRRTTGPTATFAGAAVALVLLVAACVPKAKLLRSGVAGTIVANANTEAAALATVYLLDDTGADVAGSLTRTNQAGRFRIDAAPGHYTLVALDGAGSATTLPFDLASGELRDLGPIPLAPCVSGTSPNAAAMPSCPAPIAGATPPASFSVDRFVADRVEATLYATQSPTSLADGATEELFVVADDDAQGLELEVWMPSSSPDFGAGSYTAQTDAADPTGGTPAVAVSLVYTDASGAASYYLLTQGTLAVTSLDGRVGGLVSLTLSNATFAWADPSRPVLDTSHTVAVAKTDPAIAGTIVGSQYGGVGNVPTQAGGPNGTPTPAPTPSSPAPANEPLGAISPDTVYAWPKGNGGVQVESYTTVGAGYLVLALDVDAVHDSAGTFAIANTVSGPSSTWAMELFGEARWSPDGSSAYTYVLQSGTLGVSQPASTSGTTFTGTLTGATFVLVDGYDETVPGYTLTLSDSGTLSATLSSP